MEFGRRDSETGWLSKPARVMAWERDRLISSSVVEWGQPKAKIGDLGLDTTTNCNVLSALSFARRGADTVLLLLITVQ